LWGIDARSASSCGGAGAKEFTGDLAFGKVVTVRVRDIDRYKRTVAEIILPDGRNLNQELVRAGMAWWFRQFAKHDIVLLRWSTRRGAAKRGLWTESMSGAAVDMAEGSAGALTRVSLSPLRALHQLKLGERGPRPFVLVLAAIVWSESLASRRGSLWHTPFHNDTYQRADEGDAR
jgi:hypothetical protein